MTDHGFADLGWSDFYAEQLDERDAGLLPMRIANVHRARLGALDAEGPIHLELPPRSNTGGYAVGDWVLVEPGTNLLVRRLERKSVLQRRTGHGIEQLAAANVDTLFIVTSCNADFNPARLERYLALANEAGTTPVIILTKADLADNPGDYATQAAALQRDLPVVMLNPKTDEVAGKRAQWTGPGQTVALVGSSGVGKSTLVNTLAGRSEATPQVTGGIRDDDKGRHTTTSRSLHAIAGGGWVVDTPGMRTLHVSDVASGLDTLFAEITELAPLCKFRNCTHMHEPGCAVLAAVKAGTLDEDRLARWRKLTDENQGNSPAKRPR